MGTPSRDIGNTTNTISQGAGGPENIGDKQRDDPEGGGQFFYRRLLMLAIQEGQFLFLELPLTNTTDTCKQLDISRNREEGQRITANAPPFSTRMEAQ